MKELIKRFFPGLVNLRNRMYNSWKHARFKGMKAEEVFETIYRENHWNDSESVSGTGSNSEQTKIIIERLPEVFKRYNIRSMLDVPCGDFNWMKNVQMGDIRYYGADIVKELIDSNKQKYESPSRSFFVGNLMNGNLPKVDLIFCRDLLVHLSYNDIEKCISSLLASECNFILTTTFPNQINHNIVTGNWRPVNLQASPFNFPAPIEIILEGFAVDERFSDKSLGLWKRSDLQQHFDRAARK